MRNLEPPKPVDEGPSTSGSGQSGGVSLQGEQLQAFLRAAQSGQLPAALGPQAGGRPAPAVEEVEEGSDKPVHVKVRSGRVRSARLSASTAPPALPARCPPSFAALR